MKSAMCIFLNQGLGMSTGKAASQAGHAAVEAALLSHPSLVQPDGAHPTFNGGNSKKALAESELSKFIERWNAWRRGLHYAKYVMAARDSEHLRDIERYLNDRGFRTALILDEGHTEIPPITPTALGVALVDKDDPHTAATFSSFKTYKDPKPKSGLTSEEKETLSKLILTAEEEEMLKNTLNPPEVPEPVARPKPDPTFEYLAPASRRKERRRKIRAGMKMAWHAFWSNP